MLIQRALPLVKPIIISLHLDPKTLKTFKPTNIKPHYQAVVFNKTSPLFCKISEKTVTCLRKDKTVNKREKEFRFNKIHKYPTTILRIYSSLIFCLKVQTAMEGMDPLTKFLLVKVQIKLRREQTSFLFLNPKGVCLRLKINRWLFKIFKRVCSHIKVEIVVSLLVLRAIKVILSFQSNKDVILDTPLPS